MSISIDLSLLQCAECGCPAIDSHGRATHTWSFCWHPGCAHSRHVEQRIVKEIDEEEACSSVGKSL